MFNQLKMYVPIVLALSWSLYLNDWTKNLTYNLLTGNFSLSEYENLVDDNVNQREKLFTKEELIKYNNLDDGLYLSILGLVFDVSKGEEHYDKGAAYHSFTGRDASLAFVTGDFTEDGLTDDVSSLSPSQAKSLNDWVSTYQTKYVYKGKLIGKFYDENGNPTIDLNNFQMKVLEAEKENSSEEKLKQLFPPCNVEWKADVGTKVWCTDKSGGIIREWIGVPRQYFADLSSDKYRCACINLDSQEFKENFNHFKLYKDCKFDSTICTV